MNRCLGMAMLVVLMLLGCGGSDSLGNSKPTDIGQGDSFWDAPEFPTLVEREKAALDNLKQFLQVKGVSEWKGKSKTTGSDVEFFMANLSDADFHSLSCKGLIDYCVFHPEMIPQLCYQPAPEDLQKMDLSHPSKRQKEALETQRDAVLIILQEFLEQTADIPSDLLDLMVEMEMVATVPRLVEILENRPDDAFLYQGIAQLLAHARWSPWIKSGTYNRWLMGDQEVYFDQGKNQSEALAIVQKYGDG